MWYLELFSRGIFYIGLSVLYTYYECHCYHSWDGFVPEITNKKSIKQSYTITSGDSLENGLCTDTCIETRVTMMSTLSSLWRQNENLRYVSDYKVDVMASIFSVSYTTDREYRCEWILYLTSWISLFTLSGHCDVISNRLWRHQQNVNRRVKIAVFITIYGVLFWCLFPPFLRNWGNKHQNNTYVSA